jgi:hypothetical protein
MRNGSMIVEKVSHTQGYDSRSGSFRQKDAVTLPLTLSPQQSLISSVSNNTLPVDNFCKNMMWDNEKKSQVVMKAAAVLTCVDKPPAADAFRPPYAGTVKPIFSRKVHSVEPASAVACPGRNPFMGGIRKIFSTSLD